MESLHTPKNTQKLKNLDKKMYNLGFPGMPLLSRILLLTPIQLRCGYDVIPKCMLFGRGLDTELRLPCAAAVTDELCLTLAG